MPAEQIVSTCSRAAACAAVLDQSYITNLRVVGPPGVSQLPLAIFQVPHFHAMIRRSSDDPIPVEVELGDGYQIPVAGIEVVKPAGHIWALQSPHRDQILVANYARPEDSVNGPIMRFIHTYACFDMKQSCLSGPAPAFPSWSRSSPPSKAVSFTAGRSDKLIVLFSA